MKILAASIAIGFVLGAVATAVFAQPYDRDGYAYRPSYRPYYAPRPYVYPNRYYFRRWEGYRPVAPYRSYRRDYDYSRERGDYGSRVYE